MKILALDSSAPTATVCVSDDGRLLSLYSVNSLNTHSENLLPMIVDMLKRLELTVKDIDMFACSVGPGSFTGVRIGVSTIKGLAFASGKPCVGVSTLDALALNLTGFCGLIVPVMNARRGQLYTASYDSDCTVICKLNSDRAIAADALASELSSLLKPVYFCGDGYEIAVKEYPAAVSTPELLRYQSAFSVASAALKKYQGNCGYSDTALNPIYLRPSQAERELVEKEKEKESLVHGL